MRRPKSFQFFGVKSRRSSNRWQQMSNSSCRSSIRLTLEPLEERRLLAVDILGIPDWLDLGPSPMTSQQILSVSAPGDSASGAVEDVAIDPNDSSHMFAATVNGGIWRTRDGNRPFNGLDDGGLPLIVDDPLEQPSWTPVSDAYPSLAMGGIAFDPLDPTGQTVFAGTGSASSLRNVGGRPIGIMKTTDDGTSWSVIPLNPGGAEPQVRVVLPTTFDTVDDPAIEQVVLIGTVTNGLYRSTDRGETYTQISGSGVGIPAGSVTDVIVDPNDDNVYYAGVVGNGVYRSGDGGATWASANNAVLSANAALGSSTAVNLASHPSAVPTRLYAMISYDDDGVAPPELPQVFTSTDAGTNWTELPAVTTGFQSGNGDLYTSLASDQLIVDPSDENTIYIAKGYGGSPIVLRYDPGPGAWNLIDSGGAFGGTRPHVDSRDMQFVRSGGNDILLHANDGGLYFMVNPQNSAANPWTALHSSGINGIGATEFHNIAWDSRFDVATGGAQDNGTTVQNGTGDPVWTLYAPNDGGDVQVDPVNAGPGRTFRYASNQNLGFLQRHTFDSATNEPIANVGLFPAGGLANFNPPFVPHYELNSADLTRLVTGGGGAQPVYELMNAATALNPAGANWQAVPVGAGFGAVTRGTLLYGGRLNGVNNAEVLMAGSGNRVFIRSTSGGTLTATPTPFPGGNVQDIAIDPEDWQHLFVADGSGVYETADAGASWTDLTRNLGLINTRLQSIQYVPTPDGAVLVVGGNLGVSRLSLVTPNAPWSRFGAGLPNALVDELDYNAADDVLLAGTFGRGAWLVENASLVLDDPPVLTICGDEDHINQDDEIRLVRNTANPLLLDVHLNSVLAFSAPLAGFEQINVFGVGGNDELIVDTSNGMITVPEGIRYDGDGACFFDGEGHAGDAGFDLGFDTLTITNDFPDAGFASEEVILGQVSGSGRHILLGMENDVVATQTVWFEELEPVNSIVAATDFRISSRPGLGSLLQDANTLNLEDSGDLVLDAATVDDDGSPIPSSTSFEGDNTLSNQDDFYNGQVLRFTTGALTGENQEITDYDGTDRLFTFTSGFPAAPANGDAFEIIGQGSRLTVDAFEPITFTNKENVAIDAGAGDDRFFGSSNTLPFRLATLAVNGQDGDDTLTFVDIPDASATSLTGVQVDGGEGDDVVDVSEVNVATPFDLVGNDGRDSLLGGAGDDTLSGGAGDDTLIGGNPAISSDIGDNEYDGGAGFDTIVVLGTQADDIMDVFQPAPSGVLNGNYSLTSTVNGNTDNATITQNIAGQPGQLPRRPTVEELRIEAGIGNDLIRVGHSDNYADGDATNGVANQTIRFNVVGNAPNASDRLIVRDDDMGDLVLVRQGSDQRSGRVSVAPGVAGGLADVVYEGIERLDILPVDPVTGGTGDSGDGRIVVFQPDPFELNDNRLIPTDIAEPAVTPLDPNIDPGGVTNPFGDGSDVPGDEDWYEFRAPKIGTFQFDVFFDEIATVPSGRQGLPGNGELGIVVYNEAGNVIVHGRTNVTGDGVSAAISAAAEQVYYLRVRGGSEAESNAESINTYSIGIQEIDVLGPQVFDPAGTGAAIQVVTAGAPNETFDLFEIKPTQGPTPLVDGLLINIRDFLSRDLSRRTPGDPLTEVYGALDLLSAQNPGNYRVIGDHNGIMPITTVDVINAPTIVVGGIDALPAPAVGAFAGTLLGTIEPVAGDFLVFENGDASGQIREITTYNSATGAFTFADPFVDPPVAGDAFTVLRVAMATVQLNFPNSLPDDRYTLTIDDSIVDPPGNLFDGEANAHQPDPPLFPSGDGFSGGDFEARFTVDSRPEIGVWAASSVWVDTNGNFEFDPKNSDFVDRDLVYSLGFTSDNVFSGDFADVAANADGFDKLAAYGRFGGRFRWLVDTDNDGLPNVDRIDPAKVNGRPFAGNFDGNVANGDEVGLLDENAWYLDTDHDYRINNPPIATDMSGFPVVGDFDGDGTDDLATWSDDVFQIDLNRDGVPDQTFRFGFIGVREEPVTADLDQDGFDDLGLWVPDREGVPSSEGAEWYFLVSGGASLLNRVVPADDPIDGQPVIEFTPIPFGNDIYAQFGDEFARPVVGNFDPPILPLEVGNSSVLRGLTNAANPLDVDADGLVSPFDALQIINVLNESPIKIGVFYDTSGDGQITPFDALIVINYLNSSERALNATPISLIASAITDNDLAFQYPARKEVSGAYSTLVRSPQIRKVNLVSTHTKRFDQSFDSAPWTDGNGDRTIEVERSVETDLLFGSPDVLQQFWLA